MAGSATNATVGSLSAGASYTLKVVPYSHSVDGTPAQTNVTVNGTPSAPGMIRLSGSGLIQMLTWSAPTDGSPTSYIVQRSTDGVNWSAAGSTSALGLSQSLPAAGIYQFRVQGVNGFGGGTFGYSIPTGVGTGMIRPVALDGQIGRLYQAYFRRAPDSSGFGFWQGQRAAGAPIESVSTNFAASAEFVNTYGSLSNANFVSLVYANVLARTPDSGGSSYWQGRLAQGLDRGALMVGFSESPEFIIASGTLP